MANAMAARFVRLTDVGLSSGVNFLLGTALARGADPNRFGFYSFLLLGYLLVLYLTRAVVGEGALLLAVDNHDLGRLTSLATSTALGVGISCMVLAIPLTFFVTGQSRMVTMVVVVTLPLVAIQDACRYLLLAMARHGIAAASDGIWLLVAAAGIIIVPPDELIVVVLIWAVGGFVATAIALVAIGWSRPSVGLVRAWLARIGAGRLGALVSDNVITFATSLLFSITTATLLDLATLGMIRKALVVLGPVSVLNNALTVMLLADRGLGVLTMRRCLGVGGLSAIPALIWGAVLMGPAAGLGKLLAGPGWEEAKVYVPALCVYLSLQAIALVAMIVIKRLGNPTGTARLRAITLGFQTLAVLIGTADGGPGVVAGLVLAWLLLAVLAMIVLRSQLQRIAQRPGRAGTSAELPRA